MSSPWVLNLPRNSRSLPFTPIRSLRLVNAAIADAKGKDRCTIEISIASKEDDNPTTCVVGTLIPGKIEQFQMNIALDARQEYAISHGGESTISIIGYYEGGSDDQSEFDDTDIDPKSAIVVPKVERQSPALTALGGPLTRTRSKTAGGLLRRDSSASIIGFELLEKPSAKAAGKKRKAATDVPAASTSAKKAKDSNPIEPPLPTPTAYNSGGPVSNYGSPSISAAVPPALSPAPPFMLKGVTCWDLHLGEGRAAADSGTVGICFVLAVVDPVDRKRKSDTRELRPPALFTFDVTDPKVIPGLRYGVVGMKINGERHLTIPPALAFGKDGLPQDYPLYGSKEVAEAKAIPPEAWLYIKVKLFQVNGAA
ncbi:peptidylprolyl isomerase [Pleurotus pulmonarius]